MTLRPLLYEQRSYSGRDGVCVNGLNVWSVGGAVGALAEPVELGHVLFGVVQSHLDQVFQRC